MSYIIYFVIFAVVSFAALADLAGKQKKKYYAICWIVLCVFYIFRARVGTDWVIYENYYRNIFDTNEVERLNLEVGYYVLNWIYRIINLPFQVVPITISVIVCYLYSSTIKKSELTERSKGLILLAALFYMFFPTLEALRQAIPIFLFYYVVVSGVIVSTKDNTFVESLKMDFKYFVFVLIGGLFHQTVVFVEVLYYGFRKSKKLKIVSFVFLISFGTFQKQIEDLLSGYFPSIYHKYLYYTVLNESNYANNTLFSMKFFIYCIAFIVLLCLKNKDEIETRALDLVELGIVLQYAIVGRMSAVYRLVYYTDIGIILFIACFDKRLSDVKLRFLYRIVIIMIIAVLFYRNFQFDNGFFAYHFLF